MKNPLAAPSGVAAGIVQPMLSAEGKSPACIRRNQLKSTAMHCKNNLSVRFRSRKTGLSFYLFPERVMLYIPSPPFPIMRSEGIRFYISVIAVLALLLQPVASQAVSCAGMKHHAATAGLLHGMGGGMLHAGHTKPDKSGKKAASGCCDHQQCSQSGCFYLSPMAPPADSPSTVPVLITRHSFSQHPSLRLVSPDSSLFRPPISC